MPRRSIKTSKTVEPAAPFERNDAAVARAAAELLNSDKVGEFNGIPLRNLRIALGAGYWTSDGHYFNPRGLPPEGAFVSPVSWASHT